MSKIQAATINESGVNTDYSDLSLQLARLSANIWNNLVNESARAMRTIERKVETKEIKVDANVLYCRKIWLEFSQLPSTVRQVYTEEHSDNLNSLLETFYDLR